MLFRYLFKTITTSHMNFREKLDGILLLFVYAVPFFMLLGHVASFFLFFLGSMGLISGWWIIMFMGMYCAFGNFAPFFEIGSALFLDGVEKEGHLLPLLLFNFYFYMWYISLGFCDAVADVVTRRKAKWDKTVRFAKKEGA